MKWHFDNNLPIYLQACEILKIEILTGTYQAGEKFPSVRDLALSASINPNTMQKALVELEKDGFLTTNRTSGRFVTDDLDKILIERQNLAKSKVESFIEQMKKLGFEKHEIIEILKLEDNNEFNRD